MSIYIVQFFCLSDPTVAVDPVNIQNPVPVIIGALLAEIKARLHAAFAGTDILLHRTGLQILHMQGMQAIFPNTNENLGERSFSPASGAKNAVME